jgi:cupin 2 domain-containing protein
MGAESGNLFCEVPSSAAEEQFTDLLTAPGLKIERIVSNGQASPPGFWYDQGWTEWVLLLSGSAAVEFEGEAAPRELGPGSYLQIPPGRRHRVVRTSQHGPTVWLAIHLGDTSTPG